MQQATYTLQAGGPWIFEVEKPITFHGEQAGRCWQEITFADAAALSLATAGLGAANYLWHLPSIVFLPEGPWSGAD
jgi:hypothetical protein